MGKPVLLVGPTPPPTGGIATHVASLARALAVAGVGAAVVDPRRRLRFVGELSRAGIAGEVVHLHVCGHNARSYGLLAACLAATPRLPAMVTLHSGLLPAYLGAVTATGRRTIAGLLERAARVVVVSPAIAAAVRDLGVDGVELVSPFIAAGLAPGRPPVRVAAARAAGATLLVAALAPGAEYGAAVLVRGFARVAARLPEAVLLLFGAGGADRDVARRLAERGLGERVIALGELDRRAAHATLQAADVLLRPTLADGDAITVREARALGTRVVASDAAARPAGTALFPSGDAAALAEVTLRALRAPPPPPLIDDGFARLLSLYGALRGAPHAAAPVPV
jgi:glycosyltransferase involved in cell wall biosynthesis